MTADQIDHDVERDVDRRHPLEVAGQQAERALLGSLLLNPDKAAEILPTLDPRDFTWPAYEAIWDAAANLHAEGVLPDHPTLMRALATNDVLNRAGGHQLLLELRPDQDPAPQPEIHARIIRDAAAWRRAGNTLIEARRLYDAADPDTFHAVFEKLGDLAHDAAATFERKPTQTTGLPRPFSRGGSFILDAPTTVPALWGAGNEVLWAEGEALMVVGPQGVGKSTLIQQLVRARAGIGTGEVLGYQVEPGQKNVLYLACDRPRQIRRSMARMFTSEDRDALDDRLHIWEGPPPFDFAKNTAYLAAMAKAADADTVIVDSLKDVAIGLSEDEVGAAYNRARQTALAEGVQIIEAHHQTKRGAGGTGKPDTLADVYGSVWITAGTGAVVLLWGSAGDPIVELSMLKTPLEEVGPLRVLHDHTDGTSSVWHATDLLIIAKASPTGLTAKNAATALFSTDKPTAAQVEKARRRLDAMEAKGLLRKYDGDPKTGSPASYHPADQLPIGEPA